MAGKVIRKRWLAVGAFLLVAGALGTVAYADTINPDGDTVRPNNRLQYGSGGFQEPCSNRGTPVAGAVTVRFNGTVHFDSGSMLTVTATPDADATAAGITASGSTAVVPTPWDTPQQTFTIPITTTVPPSAADGSYTVNVSATGPAHRENGDALTFTQHDSYAVTIDCVAGGNVAPTASWNAHPFQSATGDTKSYTFGISDPDSSSFSFAPGYPSCGANGTVSNAIIDSLGGNASFDCTFGSTGTSTVRARVTDGTSTSNELTQDVVVGVGPLASIAISPKVAGIPPGRQPDVHGRGLRRAPQQPRRRDPAGDLRHHARRLLHRRRLHGLGLRAPHRDRDDCGPQRHCHAQRARRHSACHHREPRAAGGERLVRAPDGDAERD